MNYMEIAFRSLTHPDRIMPVAEEEALSLMLVAEAEE